LNSLGALVGALVADRGGIGTAANNNWSRSALGNLELTVDGGFSPTVLPKKEPGSDLVVGLRENQNA
jgi:hypothetical protein